MAVNEAKGLSRLFAGSEAPSGGEAPSTEETGAENVDVSSLMIDIRARVRSSNLRSPRSGVVTAESEELRYINDHHSYPLQRLAFTSHRRKIGHLIVALKTELGRLFHERLLRPYFEREYTFQTNVAKQLNQINRRLGELGGLSVEALHSEVVFSEKRAADLIGSVEARFAERMASVESTIAAQEERLHSLSGVITGIERIVARISKFEVATNTTSDASRAATDERATELSNLRYLLLENRFRGPKEEISRRLERYAQMLQTGPTPILDLGSGRGELLGLLRGCDCYGVDSDAAMVEECLQQGLNVIHSDLIEHLSSLADRSIGSVAAVQVIEHLGNSTLQTFLSLLGQKLKPGGKVIFETINTASLVALAQNYYRDPTHVMPRHPDTVRYLIELAGFKILELERVSPYPEEAVLLPVPEGEFATPRERAVNHTANENIDRLNRLLFGYQDYYILAELAAE
jgi:SAM-dependent methyltransferase